MTNAKYELEFWAGETEHSTTLPLTADTEVAAIEEAKNIVLQGLRNVARGRIDTAEFRIVISNDHGRAVVDRRQQYAPIPAEYLQQA